MDNSRETMSDGSVNLWEEALEKAKSANYDETKSEAYPSTALYVLGNTKAGKSSLIDELLFRNYKPCTDDFGLEYSHGVRRNKKERIPRTVDILEFAGQSYDGPETIKIPISTLKNLDQLTVILVLDMEDLEFIWNAFEKTVTQLSRAFKSHSSTLSPSDDEELKSKLMDRVERRGVTTLEVNPSEADLGLREFFPFPLVIVGGKYDEFVRRHEPAKQKSVCRFLRLLALKYQATLVYYSAFEITLNTRIRSILSHYAYGTAFPNERCTDYFDPVVIPPHCDTWDDIKFPLKLEDCTLSHLKEFAYQEFGIEECSADHEVLFDPITDKMFRELKIDTRYQDEMEQLEDEEFERQYKELKKRDFYY